MNNYNFFSIIFFLYFVSVCNIFHYIYIYTYICILKCGDTFARSITPIYFHTHKTNNKNK